MGVVTKILTKSGMGGDSRYNQVVGYLPSTVINKPNSEKGSCGVHVKKVSVLCNICSRFW